MSNDILDNINNAAAGHPYNGSGISASGYGQDSLPTASNISGNTVNLGGTMNLTHSLNGIRPMNLNESGNLFYKYFVKE